MKSSFILHLDSLCILDKLTDEQAGKLFKAMYQYQQTKELPELDTLLDMAITPFINQFIRDESKYEETSEERKLAGSLGGKKRAENAKKQKELAEKQALSSKSSKCLKSKQNQANVANQADSDSDSENDSDKENEKYSFDAFWDLYDKKVGVKERVQKKYEALPEETKAAIFEHLPKYKAAQPDKQFRKDPQTYLNNRAWEDEIIARGGAPVFQMQGTKVLGPKDFYTDEEYQDYLKRQKVS